MKMGGFVRIAGGIALIALVLLGVGCGKKGNNGSSSSVTYTVGGTVTGLNGTVVLQLNGSNDLAISANGAFAFSTGIADGGSYTVTIKTPPVGQVCTIANGTGTVATSNITNVSVVCGVAQYSIGGTITGLKAGGTVVLQNNGGDDLTVTGNGDFGFAALLPHNGPYNVTVKTNPNGQQCSVAAGAGTATANIANIVVTCVSYWTVGGTVSGLTGTVILQNNGGDDRSVSADGSFTFATQVLDGSSYVVTVGSQPAEQDCNVNNGSGTVNGANVTSVAVACVVLPPAAPTLSLGYGIKTFKFSWAAIASTTHYRLLENPDGVSGFTQVGTDIPSSTTGYDHVVALYLRVNAEYKLQACNGAGCTDSAVLPITGNLVEAIGYFKASNTGASDSFGGTVAISTDGSTLAVGASFESSSATGVNGIQNDNSAVASGAVYVFTRTGNTWSQQAYVKASNAEANDFFGSSVTLSADGNTLAVGAFGEASVTSGVNGNESGNSAGRSGAAYVFTRTGNSWSQQAYVKASNTGANDLFGLSVSLSADGNTLAVGAREEDSNAMGINGDESDNSMTNSGAVYVFTRIGSTWSQQAYVKASNSGDGGPIIFDGDNFGTSVALSADGNTLAVGAVGEASNATGINGNQNDNSVRSGAAYIFTRSGVTWSQQAYMKASNTGPDAFGHAVAISADGNTLAVGAYGEASNATGVNGNESDNSATNSGAVYVYTRSDTTWSQQAYVKASNTDENDQFGFSIALSADGNMLAVGARYEDHNDTGLNGDQNSTVTGFNGAVYVFTRTGTVWSQKVYVKASNTDVVMVNEAIDMFGYSVSLTADGNTLAVGSRDEDSNATGIGGDQTNSSAQSSGAAYLY